MALRNCLATDTKLWAMGKTSLCSSDYLDSSILIQQQKVDWDTRETRLFHSLIFSSHCNTLEVPSRSTTTGNAYMYSTQGESMASEFPDSGHISGAWPADPECAFGPYLWIMQTLLQQLPRYHPSAEVGRKGTVCMEN